MCHKLAIILSFIASTALAQSTEGISKDRSVHNSHLYHVQIKVDNGAFRLHCNGLVVPPSLQRNYLDVLLDQAEEGDLVLMEVDAADVPSWFVDQLFDSIRLFGEKKVALRFSTPSEKVSNVFWWVSPYDLPGDHADTFYYWNHVRLGRGDEGFERVLRIIGEFPEKGGTVCYSIGEYRALGHANGEVPYRTREDDLQRIAKSKHVAFQRLDTVPAKGE